MDIGRYAEVGAFDGDKMEEVARQRRCIWEFGSSRKWEGEGRVLAFGHFLYL